MALKKALVLEQLLDKELSNFLKHIKHNLINGLLSTCGVIPFICPISCMRLIFMKSTVVVNLISKTYYIFSGGNPCVGDEGSEFNTKLKQGRKLNTGD